MCAPRHRRTMARAAPSGCRKGDCISGCRRRQIGGPRQFNERFARRAPLAEGDCAEFAQAQRRRSRRLGGLQVSLSDKRQSGQYWSRGQDCAMVIEFSLSRPTNCRLISHCSRASRVSLAVCAISECACMCRLLCASLLIQARSTNSTCARVCCIRRRRRIGGEPGLKGHGEAAAVHSPT